MSGTLLPLTEEDPARRHCCAKPLDATQAGEVKVTLGKQAHCILGKRRGLESFRDLCKPADQLGQTNYFASAK